MATPLLETEPVMIGLSCQAKRYICQSSASRLSPDGDSSRISAEVDGFLKDPFYTKTLVKHSEVRDVVQPSSIRVGDVYTVVDGHSDVFLCIIDEVSGHPARRPSPYSSTRLPVMLRAQAIGILDTY